MRLVFFFIVIALAAGAFFVTLQFTSKPQEEGSSNIVQEPRVEVREAAKSKVFVARQDIPIGSVISRTMLDIVDYQQNLILPDMAGVTDPGASPVDGMVSRAPLVKGEVIMKSKFANPKDPSFVAAGLPEGMRMVTIAVDVIAGGGGFIYPGDRVDILITRDISGGAASSLKMPVSEILAPNVKVLAVNQKSTVQAGEGPTVPSNVSLEVTPLDAERLRLAEGNNGRVSLALRSLKDKDSMVHAARPAGLSDLSRLMPASYFPLLFENLNSYTPKVITSAPGKVEASDIDSEKNAANTVADSGLAGQANTLDLIRGVKKESVEITGPSPY